MLSPALRTAFKGENARYVVLDGWCPQWQWDEVKAAVDADLLEFLGESGGDEQQYTGLRFGLTKAGRQELEAASDELG